ncbi:MAG TPA: ZIP family metal transporter [Fimbriimonadaceae bacterium]|nr:ZIP family metal transporter [Fimbriimonadaceae bacterium]
MTSPIVAALVATGIAVAGAAIGMDLAGAFRTRLQMLVHVATGALLAITAFDILPEAKAALTWPVFLACALAGYGLLWAVGKFVFYVCPSCAITHIDEASSMARRGSLILLATALGTHCLLDGLAISAGSDLPVRAGMGALIAVAIHKLPEGLALGLLLTSAGYRRRSAVAIASMIEGVTVIGAIAAALFSPSPGPAPVGAILALVGGGFVYLVTNAFGGALEHPAELPRVRTITAEALSFAVTGVLFLLIGRV